MSVVTGKRPWTVNGKGRGGRWNADTAYGHSSPQGHLHDQPQRPRLELVKVIVGHAVQRLIP